MIESTLHDDVEALRLSWWRSRAIGYGVHVFLVRGVLIDSGFPAVEHDVREILGRGVRGAMITHLHEDHAGNVPLLAERGVPMAADARTLAYARAPEPIGLYRHITWRAPRPLVGRTQVFADDLLEMLPTPGHSADHHAVWDHRTNTVFAGDLYLGVKVRVAHRYEDPYQQLASLRLIAGRRPARLFCAHRGAVANPDSMLRAKGTWLEETIAAVQALAAEGARLAEIRHRVLGTRDFTHWVSHGDYSPDNLVRAILRDRITVAPPSSARDAHR